MSAQSTNRFRVIKIIAWIYVALGAALVSCALSHIEIHGQRLGAVGAVPPALMVLGAVGTLLRRQWGRFISYFFSALLLLGVPVGTFLGVYMIARLTRDKDLFVKA